MTADIGFSEAATSLRLSGIQDRVNGLKGQLERKAGLLESLPASVSDDPKALKLADLVADATKRSGELIASIEIDSAEVNNVGALVADLAMVGNQASELILGIGAMLRKKYPKASWDEFSSVGDIRAVTDMLLMDLQWLLRISSDDVPESADSKQQESAEYKKREGMRLLRARRKAGYRMARVPIHTKDIEGLVRVGLLDRRDQKDLAAIEDALQKYLLAAISMVETDMRKKPAQRRDEWMDRFACFVRGSMRRVVNG